MITLLGSLLGFFGAAFPEILKMFTDKADKKHELTIMQLQMEQQRLGHLAKLEEINANADIAESSAIYKTYSTNIRWVDALNGTVRPVMAYAFFLAYAFVKIGQYHSGLPWLLWTEEDQIIFATIISFYYGGRAMKAARK